jgi:hypothetical protein
MCVWVYITVIPVVFVLDCVASWVGVLLGCAFCFQSCVSIMSKIWFLVNVWLSFKCWFGVLKFYTYNLSNQNIWLKPTSTPLPKTEFSTQYSHMGIAKDKTQLRRDPGDRGSTMLKVLRYKSEGRWFDPRWCHGIFYYHKSFWLH